MATVETESIEAADPGPAAFEEPPCDERVLGLPNWESLPYPGLRAFHRDEMEIFFGREAALDSMVDRLARTKFLAVLGPSGCGKSSLVRTGLYNALELGFLPHAGGRWKIAELNPGRQPIRNLARALAEIIGGPRPVDAAADTAAENLVAAHLKRGPRSVVELGEGGLLADGGNLLIVVDQFEELFRFRHYSDREEAEAFVGLLLESARSELPIHIVITMRSEYVGACSLLPGLAEQISEGMFLTPRMTRDECRQAIEGPSNTRGFDIEPELVARILNELQSFAAFDRSEGLDEADQLSLQADQLPLMQHMLNRIWRLAVTEHRAAGGRLTLTLHDYDEVGGLTGALDDHGAEILAALVPELGADGARTVEHVFRALVDGPDLPRAVRRLRTIGELVAAAGGEERRDDVRKVVEAFRGRDCNFLRTSEPVLDDDVVVDLGHESLIRRWSCLRDWFAAEVEARTMWHRLSQDADLWKQREGGLLRDLGVRRFVDWREREKPTACLAGRYGGNFEEVQAFLAASEAAELRRKRKEKRGFYLKLLAGFLIFLLLCTIIAIGESRKYFNQISASYAYEALALREYLGRTHCSGRPKDSPSFETCLQASLTRFEDQYLDPGTRQLRPPPPPPTAPAQGGMLQ